MLRLRLYLATFLAISLASALACSGIRQEVTPCRLQCAQQSAACAVETVTCFEACKPPAAPAPAPEGHAPEPGK